MDVNLLLLPDDNSIVLEKFDARPGWPVCALSQ